MVYQSQHGHSHFVIEPTSATLNVVYSPDWQTKVSDGRAYVEERAHLLFDILEEIEAEPPLYCGSVTRVRLATTASDEDLGRFFAKSFAPYGDPDTCHDVFIKVTNVVDDTFFSNLTMQMYRMWNIGLPQIGTMRLSRRQAVERGVEILGDFNSRYAFNEGKEFEVTKHVATVVLDANLAAVDAAARRLGGRRREHHRAQSAAPFATSRIGRALGYFRAGFSDDAPMAYGPAPRRGERDSILPGGRMLRATHHWDDVARGR